MIVTVTLNAALDVTYEVPRLVPHHTHRVTTVSSRAGGKGVNVASYLAAFGIDVVATGLVGGPVGTEIVADLDSRRIRHAFTWCAGESRRTVNVVSLGDGEATIFNEPGPRVSTQEWALFLSELDRVLGECRPSVLVASGSLPPGAPRGCYAELVTLAHAHGSRCIVDADGEPLRLALPARPDVVKPNRDELFAVTGTHDPVTGARILQQLGARHVLVSSGADGVVAVPDSGPALHAGLHERLDGNPTGAGDAATAAVAAGLDRGQDWLGFLGDVVAWSAAAVRCGVAGEVSRADIDHLSPRVRIGTP